MAPQSCMREKTFILGSSGANSFLHGLIYFRITVFKSLSTVALLLDHQRSKTSWHWDSFDAKIYCSTQRLKNITSEKHCEATQEQMSSLFFKRKTMAQCSSVGFSYKPMRFCIAVSIFGLQRFNTRLSDLSATRMFFFSENRCLIKYM